MHLVFMLRRLIQKCARWLERRLARAGIWVIFPGRSHRLTLPQSLEALLDERSQEIGVPLEKLLPGLLRAAFQQRRGDDSLEPAWGSLTEREREVARLMAQGLSNQAIAARLTISQSTVKTHTRRVLAKLGCRSRRELPAMPVDIRRLD